MLLASILMVAAVFILAALSVGNASKYGYAHPSSFGFSFGGIAELRNTIEIPLEQADSLFVEYGSKNLRIFKSDSDKIIIKEYLPDDRKEALATVDISNGVATVTSPKLDTFIVFGFNVDERIEIYIPAEGMKDISLKTGSGNIKTQPGYTGTYETLAVKTGSGNIKWNSSVVTEASFKAGSGNIEIVDLTGTLRAEAGSGNVTVDDFIGCGEIQTSSGNVKSYVKELNGDLRLGAGSGNVKLEIPEETSAHLDIATGSGDIHTDFDDLLSFDKYGNQADGDLVSNPANQIEVNTGSGNVRVLSH